MTTKEILRSIAKSAGGTYEEFKSDEVPQRKPDGGQYASLTLKTSKGLIRASHECSPGTYDKDIFEIDVERLRFKMLINISIHGIKRIDADEAFSRFSSQGLDLSGHPSTSRNPYEGIDYLPRRPIYLEPPGNKTRERAIDTALAISSRTTEVHFGHEKIGATAVDRLIEDAKKIEAYLNGEAAGIADTSGMIGGNTRTHNIAVKALNGDLPKQGEEKKDGDGQTG